LTLAEDPLANAKRRAKFPFMPSAIAKRKSVKSEAIKLVRGLPESTTWDDLMYRIYVRQKIEAGLSDIRAGRVHSHASIRKEFALP
jgi:predicted transcriptional regulator